MATFTVTTTITGTVNGRSISATNTFTIADIVHVVEDASEFTCASNQSNTQYSIMNKSTSSTYRRGLYDENGPALMAFAVTNAGGVARLHHDHDAGDGSSYTFHTGGLPSLFHHSGTFDGSVNGDGGPTIPDPTGNVTAYGVQPVTSVGIRAFALLKAVS